MTIDYRIDGGAWECRSEGEERDLLLLQQVNDQMRLRFL
jgi:hypothetical protein